MKIIFSPSKDMILDHESKNNYTINKTTKSILNILINYNDNELKKNLKINDSILKTVKEYLKSHKENKSYPSIFMYNGLSFRTTDVRSLKEDSIDYLNKNLVILSALYGPISANTLIKPYRLDFQTKVKINGNTLKNLWKNEYNNYFNENETIINLASNEFSDLLNKNKFNWVDVEFYKIKDGKLKSHSTTSKKGRGAMLRFLAINKIKHINDIKKFNYDNYRLNKKSTSNKLIFVK